MKNRFYTKYIVGYKIDKEDIDEWYEEEKERINKELIDEIKNKGNKRKAEEDYHKKFHELTNYYNELMARCIENNKKMERFKKKADDFKSRLKKKIFFMKEWDAEEEQQ